MNSFNNFQGVEASNPFVSTGEKPVAFQNANNTDPAGVGYGILLDPFE